MTAQAESDAGVADTRVARRLAECSPLVRAVCTALAAEIDKLAFPAGAIKPEPPEEGGYRLSRDSAPGADGLVGVWRDARWFVEAVTAWGRGEIIRSKPRLPPVAS
jgi:hypothetical protein